MNEPKVCEPYKDGNPMGLPAHRLGDAVASARAADPRGGR